MLGGPEGGGGRLAAVLAQDEGAALGRADEDGAAATLATAVVCRADAARLEERPRLALLKGVGSSGEDGRDGVGVLARRFTSFLEIEASARGIDAAGWPGRGEGIEERACGEGGGERAASVGRNTNKW